MQGTIKRRDFLKLMGAGLAGLALPHRITSNGFADLYTAIQSGRVTKESLSVHALPNDTSRILFQRFRDEVINLYYEQVSEDGPGYNPLWYRVWGGWMHSGYIQKVHKQLNALQEEFPSPGQLMELTVPYSDSYRHRQSGAWEKFYRLYFSSTHWVFSAKPGPDGKPWYEIRDGLMDLSYYVPGAHLRKVTGSELATIHPQVPAKDKRIEISIDQQKLYAYEGSALVKEFRVSTGVPNLSSDPNAIPSATPRGKHRIHAKRPSVHMGDGTLRSDAEAYELPGVPWVSYFEASTGVAIHGTYWHNNFGMTMSHGCINMYSEDAKWVYCWASAPQYSASEENGTYQTPVTVY